MTRVLIHKIERKKVLELNKLEVSAPPSKRHIDKHIPFLFSCLEGGDFFSPTSTLWLPFQHEVSLLPSRMWLKEEHIFLQPCNVVNLNKQPILIPEDELKARFQWIAKHTVCTMKSR